MLRPCTSLAPGSAQLSFGLCVSTITNSMENHSVQPPWALHHLRQEGCFYLIMNPGGAGGGGAVPPLAWL